MTETETESFKEINILAQAAPAELQDMEELIAFLAQESDIFTDDYCSHWAKGAWHGRNCGQPDLGWLLWEEGAFDYDYEEDHSAAIAAFRQPGQALPKHYYRLDKAMATRIVHQGVYQYGISFIDGEAGSDMIDVIIQKVLLGELTYC